MCGKETSIELGLNPAPKSTPIRTYSRHDRALKRNFTSLSELFTQADDVTTAREDDLHEIRCCSEPYDRLKRLRASFSLVQSPTNVFWEHLNAPASTFIRPRGEQQPGNSVAAETDQTDPDIAYMTPDEEPPKLGLNTKKSIEHQPVSGETHKQPSRTAPSTEEQNEKDFVVEDSTEDLLQHDLFDDTATTTYHKSSIKQGTLMCMNSSPPTRKPKTRCYQDVDESLSAAKLSPASARRHLMPRKSLSTPSDVQKPNGTHVSKKVKSKHSVNGSDSVSGPWPIPTPTDRSKHVDFKEYKDVKAAMDTKHVRSHDGFERGEARPGFLGKKRRTDSSAVSIGPLEITQKGVVTQKLKGSQGPRGQKKTRVSTTASVWRARQYFRISSEESPDELGYDHPTSTGQATRIRSKQRISRISDDADLSTIILSLPTEIDQHKDSAFDEAKVARSSPHTKKPSHGSDDADEPIDLLILPSDGEYEADFTIPRTDTPESNASVTQLPPKCWVLSKQNDNQDALALRPTSRAWKREASVVAL